MKIAIASGKGGTGKTTLSTNFAHFLAQENRVVLVDLDVEEPNAKLFVEAEMTHVHDMFKMIPSWDATHCHQCAVCVKHCHYNALLYLGNEILIFPNLCHSCYACSELCPTNSLPMQPQKMGELTHYVAQDFSLIEGRLCIGEEQSVALIHQTKKYVEKYFGDDTIKIYDAPPGTSCPMVEAIKGVDFVILVTEPTPFGLHDLMLAVETVRVMGKPFGIVINRDGMGDDRVMQYAQQEGIEILARIPHSKTIAQQYANATLIYPVVESFAQALQTLYQSLHVKGLK